MKLQALRKKLNEIDAMIRRISPAEADNVEVFVQDYQDELIYSSTVQDCQYGYTPNGEARVIVRIDGLVRTGWMS